MAWKYKTTQVLSEVTDFLNEETHRPPISNVHITMGGPNYHVWVWVDAPNRPMRRSRDVFASENYAYSSHSLPWEPSKSPEDFQAQVLNEHGRESVIVGGIRKDGGQPILTYFVATHA